MTHKGEKKMTKKDYQIIVDILNQMNMNIDENNLRFSDSELLAQKNLMDMLVNLFGSNFNMLYENFDFSKFNKAYKSNF